MIETSLIVLGLVVVAQIAKKWVIPKFGPTGLHIFVFTIALGVVVVQALMSYYPGLGEVLAMAGKYLAMAIAVYEVILKRLNEKLNIGME